MTSFVPPFQRQCECAPVFCPNNFNGGSCSPANICTNVPHTACQPTGNGLGIELPWPNDASPSLPAPAVGTPAAGLFAASALAAWAHVPHTGLLFVLAAAALAYDASRAGVAAVAWWVWLLGAIAACAVIDARGFA